MSEERHAGRLHPSSVLFRLLPHARALVLPGLVVLVLSQEGRWQLWLMLMFVPSTIYELGQYFTLRYQVRPEELVVKSGLLWKRERRIPVTRIHSIDMTQGVLHRVLGVADVRVETAGGTEPEAVLRVLGLADVRRLRAGISRERIAAGEGAEPGESQTRPAGDGGSLDGAATLVRLDTAELLKLGMISMRGAAAAAVLIGLAWEFDLLERLDLSGRIDVMSTAVRGWRLALVGAVVVFGLPTLLVLVSMAWTVVRLHGFELIADGEDLRLRCGLFTRVNATVPRRRIQFVSVISSPLHRLFRRVTVRVETAGGSREHEEKKIVGQRWFVPLLPEEACDLLLHRIVGAVDLPALGWRGLSPRAFRRAAKRAVLVALVITGIASAAYRPWGSLSAVALVPLMLWHARVEVRRTAYALFEGGVAFRSGVLTRRISLTFFDKVQLVSLEESPFDRRHRMASVDVDTAGAGAAGHRVRIPYLDRATAEAVYRALTGGMDRSVAEPMTRQAGALGPRPA